MDLKVIWLRDAVDDLEQIGEYIAANSAAYASTVIKKIYDAAMELAQFPQIGRVVPEWEDAKYRERIVYRYRLIYRLPSNDRIEILAIIHGARLLPDDLRSRAT
jgi:plasmid stabilization system protein ParE